MAHAIEQIADMEYMISCDEINWTIPNYEMVQIRNILDWLEQNFDYTDYFILYESSYEKWPQITFRNQECEMAFKLKWM